MANRSTFYVLKRRLDSYFFQKEEGELIIIKNQKFGIYRSYITIDGMKRKRWFVVELECGQSFGSGDTKAQALMNARNNLEQIHPMLFANKITESIKRFGRSPLYQQGLDLSE